MRFYDVEVYKSEKTGSDKLGNPIVTLAVLANGEGRKGTWTAEEIALDNRIVTKKLQKAITTVSKSSLSKAVSLRLNGELFDIEEVKGEDDDRWRIVYLKKYRG